MRAGCVLGWRTCVRMPTKPLRRNARTPLAAIAASVISVDSAPRSTAWPPARRGEACAQLRRARGRIGAAGAPLGASVSEAVDMPPNSVSENVWREQRREPRGCGDAQPVRSDSPSSEPPPRACRRRTACAPPAACRPSLRRTKRGGVRRHVEAARTAAGAGANAAGSHLAAQSPSHGRRHGATSG